MARLLSIKEAVVLSVVIGAGAYKYWPGRFVEYSSLSKAQHEPERVPLSELAAEPVARAQASPSPSPVAVADAMSDEITETMGGAQYEEGPEPAPSPAEHAQAGNPDYEEDPEQAKRILWTACNQGYLKACDKLGVKPTH